MQTQEISREQWSDFFNSFSKRHEGWLTTVEIFENDLGAQQEGRELSFEGISLNSADANSGAILINLGQSPSDHLSHSIKQPKHVWLQQTDQGADAFLEIEAEDDSRTLLRFRTPMPSQSVK
jgi:hypothetical protein